MKGIWNTIKNGWKQFASEVDWKYRPGMRAVKTVLAVTICLLISLLLDDSNILHVSTIAAIITMRPSQKDSVHIGVYRIIGTLVGGALGLLCLVLGTVIPFYAEGGFALLIPLMMLVDIYICNVINIKDALVISCVVLLLVATHINIPMNEVFRYAALRVVDTIIGVVIATAVNMLVVPRRNEAEEGNDEEPPAKNN